MQNIKSYILGEWSFGSGQPVILKDAYTAETFCQVNSDGFDFAEIVNYGRTKGRETLSKMTFPQRGLMLKKLALHLMECKENFYEVSYKTGATQRDGWIDIEGGIGNLFSYASLRKNFIDRPFMIEDETIPLSQDQTFSARHILVPKQGVALHINAHNFPVWGMLEKIAVNLLAGVPAIVKPSTASCYLTECVVREIINSGILPEGSLQLICGGLGDTFEHLNFQDTVTFTGSLSTGVQLKNHPNIAKNSIAFTMEADSLNSMILTDDVRPEDPEFQLMVKEAVREICIKCGQKCTAARRLLVPQKLTEIFIKEVASQLEIIEPENPRNERAKFGSLLGEEQLNDVLKRTTELLSDSEIVFGKPERTAGSAYTMKPVLLYNPKPSEVSKANSIEAFGPVATVMPYDDLQQAITLANAGKGSLCCSVIAKKKERASRVVIECGGFHGRILILNRTNAKTSTGHGSPLALLTHGGPGRAGGGEEMGGIRGIKHFMQRFALQGPPDFLTSVSHAYSPGKEYIRKDCHPFQAYFEDLEIGETLITHKRTFTEADISNFSNLTWDHFHVHTDHTSLDGTIFERPVVHGYLILSAAAGLFVDARRGNVMLNYGMEECRFLKPLYAGDTIGVRLTVKEKIPREKKDADFYPQGIVKFFVDIRDQNDEMVAFATILTLVRARNELLE